MHFRADTARVGARRGVVGPELFLRPVLRHRLRDRQRIPHRHVVEQQHRHLAGRTELGNLPGGVLDIQYDAMFIEVDVGFPQQEPGPQGPGRIVFVADYQFGFHACNHSAVIAARAP